LSSHVWDRHKADGQEVWFCYRCRTIAVTVSKSLMEPGYSSVDGTGVIVVIRSDGDPPMPERLGQLDVVEQDCSAAQIRLVMES
jgi:hypothetical protein